MKTAREDNMGESEASSSQPRDRLHGRSRTCLVGQRRHRCGGKPDKPVELVIGNAPGGAMTGWRDFWRVGSSPTISSRRRASSFRSPAADTRSPWHISGPTPATRII